MNVVGWQAWVVIGCVAGWLASVIIRSRQGWPMNMVIGATGAFIGGSLVNLPGISGTNGFNLLSMPVAVIGAVALLGMARLSVGKSRAAY